MRERGQRHERSLCARGHPAWGKARRLAGHPANKFPAAGQSQGRQGLRILYSRIISAACRRGDCMKRREFVQADRGRGGRVAALGHARNRRVSRFWLRSCVPKVSHRLSTSKGPPMIGSVARRRHYATCLLSDTMTPFSWSQSNPHVLESDPPVPYSRAWQDMSLSESPSAWGAVSRSAPRMPLMYPIITEQSLYLS